MNEQEVRLHDVTVDGDVDRAAVLAAIEQAVGRATASGATSSEAIRSSVARAVGEAHQS